jgi:hypothetical protein
VVNLAFARGGSARTARAIPQGETLLRDELVHLRVDIGPRSPESIVVNPSRFPAEAIDWSAPEVIEAKGVWIEAVVFTQDFDLPGTDLLALWLPQWETSGRLYIPLIPRRAGMRNLRLCLYYKDNLLQSFMVEAFVSPTGGKEMTLPAEDRAILARLEYSTIGAVEGIERKVPERAATIPSWTWFSHTPKRSML